MAITATNAGSGTNFDPIPAGTYIARCYSMVHIGTIPETFQGENKMMNKVRINWELPTETKVFSEDKGEQPFSLGKEFTLSMNEKATMRKFLEGWRGKAFTEEESKAFDITALLDKPCMLNVIHKVSKTSGKIYAEIASVSPMLKGIDCPHRHNDLFVFHYEPFEQWRFDSLPEWLRAKVVTSAEYKSAMNPQHTETVNESNDVDPLPF